MKAQQEENSNMTKLPMNVKSASILAAVIFGSVLQAGCAMSPAAEEEIEPVVESVKQVQSADTEAVQAKNDDVEKAKVVVQQKAVPKVDSKAEKAAQEAEQRKAAEMEMAAKKARAEAAEAKAAEAAKSAEKASADTMMSSLASKDKYAVIAAEAPATETKTAAKTSKETTSAKRKALVKKPLNVGLKDLPVTIGLWSIARNLNDNSLEITTPTWQMGDGSYLSQVWITLKDNEMIVNSSSDIDAKGNGSGVVLNGGELMPFTRIDESNRAVLEGDWMQRLSDGGTLEIYMGFFPGKTPRSPTFKSDASLDALSRLVPTYENLSQ